MGMGRSLSVALVVVVLALTFGVRRAVVFGQTSHVVINEVELNPPEDDRLSTTMEWVELYNPTATPVDIGGWKVSTTHGQTVTVTIPSSTILQSGGYHIVQRAGWLDNDDECVILDNAAGNEVDRTRTISDDDNDGRAWARFPNGKDTDSAGDWAFQASTKSASNGGEELLKTASSITCSVNTSSIQVGGSIGVSGAIQPPIAGATVSVVYISPAAVTTTYSTTSQSDGTYSHAFTPAQVGSWSVRASWPGDATYRSAESQTVGFTVSKLRTTIVLSLSKDRLSPGETLTISGSIAPAVSGLTVKLEYRVQGAAYFALTSVVTDDSGSFFYVWRDTPRQIGSYDLRASWTGDERHEGAEARASLTIAATPSSITVQVDQLASVFGQTISINGSTVPVHADVYVELTLARPDGSTTTRSCMTSTDGIYRATFVPDKAGSWTVKAQWSGDADHEGAISSGLIFTIEKAPTVVSITVSPSSVDEGSSVKVSGAISPALTGALISVTLTRPDGSIVPRSVTSSDGLFSDNYTPGSIGRWTVRASWLGNENYLGSTSEQSSFTVSKPFPLALAVLAIMAVGVGGYLVLRARRKPESRETQLDSRPA